MKRASTQRTTFGMTAPRGTVVPVTGIPGLDDALGPARAGGMQWTEIT
jgi:hypothetical protein